MVENSEILNSKVESSNDVTVDVKNNEKIENLKNSVKLEGSSPTLEKKLKKDTLKNINIKEPVSHVDLHTASSSSKVESIRISKSSDKDTSESEVQTQNNINPSIRYDDGAPVSEVGSAEISKESKQSIASGKAVDSIIMSKESPQTFKLNDGDSETNFSNIELDGKKETQEASVHIQKEESHKNKEPVDASQEVVNSENNAYHEPVKSENVASHDAVKSENGNSEFIDVQKDEAVTDSLDTQNDNILQSHDENITVKPDLNDQQSDTYEQLINSDVHTHTTENGVDVITETKPTFHENDPLTLPPSGDDQVTPIPTESTRTILSFQERNEFEGEVPEQISEGITGIFREYISLLPIYVQIIIDMLPLQVQHQLSEWEKNGLSPRVTVVTWITAAFTSVVCIFTLFIQRRSKEQTLIEKLGAVEQRMFTVCTERDVLKEEVKTLNHQASVMQKNLVDQRNLSIPLHQELDEMKTQNEELQSSLEKAMYKNETLEGKLVTLKKIADTTDQMNKDFMEKLEESEIILSEMEQNLQKTQIELSEVKEQNEELKVSKEQLVTQVYQLDSTCNQLLQEAQVWNERVNELTGLLETKKQECEELNSTLKLKETEIKGLQNTLEKIKVIEESAYLSDEEGANLKNLMDASLVREQLREMLEEKVSLEEKLSLSNETMQEKEDKLLVYRNEIEKLKLSYNQALQDKMEAQTKLDVLANYFKEKEVQLQKELGAQEVIRQQKEEDASSASNRIALIEQENISYKHQLATLKQELEETERGYKNQVAMHEKKAHENWLAARSSERKLEEAKQESAQLRQRLTLLEREQENWMKAEVDGVVKPVPKRYLSPNGEVPHSSNQSMSQQNSVELHESSNSALPLSRGIPDPSKIPNPPLLPMDRPLPPPPALHPMDPRFPLPPPPFIPPLPFGERLPPPHFLDPWRFPPPPMPPPMHRRMSPQDYDRGHLSTPPRSVTPPYDRELDRHSINSREIYDRRPPLDRFSPPLRDTGSRDSRNSSPPHILPRFHDNPPPRPYRFPMPPPSMMPPRFTPPPPLHRREPYFPPHMHPVDQRTADRNKDPAINPPRNSHERNTPPEVKPTATAV